MAKLNAQQVGILILAAVMVIGTLGSFAVMILADQNQQVDQARYQEASDEYQKEMDKWQEQVDEQNEALTKKYFATFNRYKDTPERYTVDSVTELKTEDFVRGDGAEVKSDSALSVYYILWGPDGTTIESSIDGDSLRSPLAIDNLEQASLIDGWKEGLVGMRIGGVRLIEIPSDKAYGEAGSGDSIGPNTPLKFVVMAVEKVEEIPYPEVPDILMRGY